VSGPANLFVKLAVADPLLEKGAGKVVWKLNGCLGQ
jgi:hypothetical protein